MDTITRKLRTVLTKVADSIALPKTRITLLAGLMYTFALALMASVLVFDLFTDPEIAPDKLTHYITGRVITATVFLLAYLGITARVYCASARSFTRILLWLPSLIAFALFLGILVTLLAGTIKETSDIIGGGDPEWLDFEFTFNGAMSMVWPISIIMILTPFFIPLDVLMQIPKLAYFDVKSGFGEIDDYVVAAKENKEISGFHDVLLVEDDIYCAAVAMSFCRHFDLKCRHASSIAEADAYLKLSGQHLRLIILDNFVRVGRNPNGPRTGSEWLSEISKTWKKGSRPFKVVIISGHPELLANSGTDADLVLVKPWNPSELSEYLAECGIISLEERLNQ